MQATTAEASSRAPAPKRADPHARANNGTTLSRASTTHAGAPVEASAAPPPPPAPTETSTSETTPFRTLQGKPKVQLERDNPWP
jgi:hypothetical protein